MSEHNQKNPAQAVFIVFLLAIGAYAVWSYLESKPEAVPCTLEAKICPDGTAVGRSGPMCEFAACPPLAGPDTTLWNTSTTSEGVAFKYPEDIGTEYITETDWPPVVRVVDEAFSCTEAGNLSDAAGISERKNINGHDYCVTREGEGAAGSTYIMYAYAFPRGDDTAIMTFSLRFVQCANYSEEEMRECESERNEFNVDQLADDIISTITYSGS